MEKKETVVDGDQGDAGQSNASVEPEAEQQVQVPLSTLKAIEAKYKAEKAENAQLKTNQVQPQQPQAQPVAQPTALDILKDTPDDELIQASQVKAILKANQEAGQVQATQTQAQLASLSFMAQYPDTREVIDKLTPKLEANPKLKALYQTALAASTNPLVTTYIFAKNQGDVQEVPMSDLDKLIANAEKPQSPNAVGGGGGGMSGQQAWQTESDDQFLQRITANGA